MSNLCMCVFAYSSRSHISPPSPMVATSQTSREGAPLHVSVSSLLIEPVAIETVIYFKPPFHYCRRTESGKPTTYSMRCKHSNEVDKLLSVIQVCCMHGLA